MAWITTEFPRRIAMGMLCQPGWNVSVVSLNNGDEQRNLNWTQTRHNYDATLAVRTLTDYADVLKHFHMARGRFHTFPLYDPVDHTVQQAQGKVILDQDESPSTPQLHKRYGTGTYAYDRRITRPKQGTITMLSSGTPLTEGADYTIDYNTGAVTTAYSISTLAWSGEFYVPCRYDIDRLPTRVVDRNGSAGELLIDAQSILLVEARE